MSAKSNKAEGNSEISDLSPAPPTGASQVEYGASSSEVALDSPMGIQYTDHILMVRPVSFGYNGETAGSNHFQTPSLSAEEERVHNGALLEFEALKSALETAGVQVHAFTDNPSPHTPDSIFPNNWVSFHRSGIRIFYPLLAKNRRDEVRRDWVLGLQETIQVTWPREVDLTNLAEQGSYLEGTGSLALDRVANVAYAALSDRTTRPALERFAKDLDCSVVSFETADSEGAPIYHTNVMLSIGYKHAVVCWDCIPNPLDRSALRASLEENGKDIIAISMEQMNEFAGNQLGLRSSAGEPLIVLSSRALKSLNPDQVSRLEQHGRLIHVPLPHIELHGGGSARCMLAELHLPSGSCEVNS